MKFVHLNLGEIKLLNKFYFFSSTHLSLLLHCLYKVSVSSLSSSVLLRASLLSLETARGGFVPCSTSGLCGFAYPPQMVITVVSALSHTRMCSHLLLLSSRIAIFFTVRFLFPLLILEYTEILL